MIVLFMTKRGGNGKFGWPEAEVKKRAPPVLVQGVREDFGKGEGRNTKESQARRAHCCRWPKRESVTVTGVGLIDSVQGGPVAGDSVLCSCDCVDGAGTVALKGNGMAP